MLWWWLALACGAPEAPEGAQDGPPPALVQVAAVRSGALNDAWSALGEVHPLDQATLAAGAAGLVRSVGAREGEAVAAGALLLELDTDLVRAQLDAALAEAERAETLLAEARSRLGRASGVQVGALAPADVEALRAEVGSLDAQARALRARAREAQASLDRHRVRAPFAGVLTRRSVDPGEWVQPGQAVLELVSAQDLELRARVGAELVVLLGPGSVVTATGRSALGQPVEIQAEVVAVVPALDGDSRTALVRARPAQAAGLTPGASVPMRFPVTLESGEALVVPRDALLLSPGEDRVMRVVEGKAEPVTVKVLAAGESEVLVAPEGLAVGDLLIVRGNERVRPGQAVKVAP